MMKIAFLVTLAACAMAVPAVTPVEAHVENPFQNATCKICKAFVGGIELAMKEGNSTIDALTKIAEGLCKVIPMLPKQRQICFNMIQNIVKIKNLIITGKTPDQICQTLKYCDTVKSPGPPQCKAHTACQKLVGDCCPTTDGKMLDCCKSGPPPPVPKPQCKAHKKCNKLVGDCCPTADGVTLDCCNGSEIEDGPPPPPPPPGPKPQCKTHKKCRKLGLAGDCCPTADGVTLDCCNGPKGPPGKGLPGPPPPPPPPPPPVDPSRQCKAHSPCSKLEGNCCPTDAGVMLDCCKASCEIYPACNILGLGGDCCPNSSGKMLECCLGKELTTEV